MFVTLTIYQYDSTVSLNSLTLLDNKIWGSGYKPETAVALGQISLLSNFWHSSDSFGLGYYNVKLSIRRALLNYY